MKQYPSQILQQEYTDEWSQYLSRFPWQWFCTFTLSDQQNGYFLGLKRFHHWRFRLIKKERLQLGGYILSSHKRGHIHFHALLVGQNRHGKTLLQCSTKAWETAWPDHARISKVEDTARVSRYVSIHFMGFKSDHAEIDSFGNNLLRRVLSPQFDGFDNFDGLGTTRFVSIS